MPGFSKATIQRCWTLARGRCECQREDHGHAGRCEQRLAEHHYAVLGDNGWFTSAWDPAGDDTPENCEVLCWSCYQQLLAQPAEAAA